MEEIALKLDLEFEDQSRKEAIYFSQRNLIRVFDFGDGEMKVI